MLGTGRAARAARAAYACAALACSAIACAAVLAGCSASVDPSYDDPTPEARIGAMRASAAAGTRADVPRMVESLSADDPAVRLAAIEALQRITGTTLGYRAAAPPAARAQAIEQWKAWVREQGLQPLPPQP